jgi:type IV pilus assembly protein PilE
MRTRQSGLTLMELIVVITIIGLLTAIAYPSYRDQVRRSNRTEAKVALEQAAQSLEKCYTRFMSYDNAGCAASAQFDDDGTFSSPGNYYSISGDVAANTFTLTATAMDGQLEDTGCRTFTIDETGRRASTNSGGSTTTNCWQ